MINLANADEFPRFYSIRDPGLAEVFRIEKSADIQGSLDTKGSFDLGIGIIKGNTRYPTYFKHQELIHFWKTQARGKFVCLTLNKNVLTDIEKDKYIREIANSLFACGIHRVRIHQAAGGGVGVLYDKTNKAPKTK